MNFKLLTKCQIFVRLEVVCDCFEVKHFLLTYHSISYLFLLIISYSPDIRISIDFIYLTVIKLI